jgi:hypothetical protein
MVSLLENHWHWSRHHLSTIRICVPSTIAGSHRQFVHRTGTQPHRAYKLLYSRWFGSVPTRGTPHDLSTIRALVQITVPKPRTGGNPVLFPAFFSPIIWGRVVTRKSTLGTSAEPEVGFGRGRMEEYTIVHLGGDRGRFRSGAHGRVHHRAPRRSQR